MDYEEFVRNIRKGGLDVKEFAELIKANPNSITNLNGKDNVPKNLAIIALLLGEMKDKKVPYKHLFEGLDIEKQKPRRKIGDKNLFKKKEDYQNS
jgi:hypothetical protein